MSKSPIGGDKLMLEDVNQDAWEKLQSRIQSFEENLHSDNPQIGSYLKRINEDLRQYPELEHLLDDSEIAIIYQGMMKMAKEKVEVKKSKKRGSKGYIGDTPVSKLL